MLLFTSSLPCWDEECILLAGENPEGLNVLVESNDLMPISSGYVLTPKGIRTRENAARDLYLHVTPEGKRVKAIWPESEHVKNFVNAFPHTGVAARKLNAPGQHGLDEWARKNNMRYGSLVVDFVLRSRADFNHYKDYEQLPSDKFKFLDADRLFVKKVNCSHEELLPFIGKLHIFMTEQRRIFLPGWFDIDHDENEDWNLLAFITDTESELESLTSTLRKWGHDLIDPVNPLFIIGSSIERLRNQKEQKRTIYDWFQEETIRILRPDAPDGE